ncbi:alpha/beta hydrolase [Nonomuraea gerenzanensis]|uniref:Putative secreted protein n=1 Tax=Nonomuraea gerenzanensis TaxID=93944 RepID=A0A1M4E8Y9_9ACTN|nr:alpha/beta hydrolase family protein [Nonomuraea gerenzanensis]UBU17424.1 esterase family protein [Nonomuraea gerenzanensis]SBO95178.1 putative secreted protein [Nonomuraea gerenzanensis]
MRAGAALAVALALLALGCVPAPVLPETRVDGVRIVEQERAGERGQSLSVLSRALGRETPVRVLLPRGWTPGSGPWPVLYLLHGCCGASHLGWVEEGGAERLTDGLPAIVVVPEGGRVGFYSDWVRGPQWETFHIEELIPLIEAEFGAGPDRAVAGLSMGGLGAMVYAARHPGLFRAAASFSGVLDTTGDGSGVRRLLRENGEDPAALWGEPDGQAWEAHNPARLAARLGGVPLYVSCGDGRPGPLDPPGATADFEGALLRQAAVFAERARAAGAQVTTDFYGAGTHTWPYWERALERALPMLRAALGA